MTFDMLAWLIPSVAAGLLLFVAMLRYPKIWVGAVILATPAFLADTGEGFTASELVVGGFLFGTFTLWTVYTLATGRLRVTWIGDRLIFLFLILSATNVLVAMLNDVDGLDWLTEWVLFLLLLGYFPIKEYFGNSEKDLKQLLVLLALAVVLMSAYTAYDFMNRSSSGLVYAYQLIYSRSRLFGPGFALSLIIGAAMFFHASTLRGRLVSFGFVVISTVGLLQSMTRSLWLSGFVSLGLLLIFLKNRQRLALVGIVISIAGAAYITASIMYPKLTDVAVRILSQRLSSSTELKGGDYSFETRLLEAEAASRWIQKYPLHGSGIRSEIISWGPIEGFHWKKSFIHIGYVSLLYKFGIPITLVILAFILAFLVRNLLTSLRVRTNWKAPPIAKAVSIGVTCFFPSLLISILVAGFFDQRWGMMLLVVHFALVSITTRLLSPPDEIEAAKEA